MSTEPAPADETVARDRRPLEDPLPLDALPQYNFYYLNTCPPPRDPTIIWGTDVDCSELQAYLKRLNAESPVLVTPAHVLIAAVGRALEKHPDFNRRILRGRVWPFRGINVVMPFRTKTGVQVMFLGQAHRKSPAAIAEEAWRNAHSPTSDGGGPQPAYRRLPRGVQRILQPLHVFMVNRVNLPLRGTNHCERAAAAMVNYFGGRDTAPLRSYKPSRLPYDSITVTVTMGAVEQRPAVADGQVVARPVAPIFVRGDHRLVDAHEIGVFAETIRGLLRNPSRLDAPAPPGRPPA